MVARCLPVPECGSGCAFESRLGRFFLFSFHVSFCMLPCRRKSGDNYSVVSPQPYVRVSDVNFSSLPKPCPKLPSVIITTSFRVESYLLFKIVAPWSKPGIKSKPDHHSAERGTYNTIALVIPIASNNHTIANGNC